MQNTFYVILLADLYVSNTLVKAMDESYVLHPHNEFVIDKTTLRPEALSVPYLVHDSNCNVWFQSRLGLKRLSGITIVDVRDERFMNLFEYAKSFGLTNAEVFEFLDNWFANGVLFNTQMKRRNFEELYIINDKFLYDLSYYIQTYRPDLKINEQIDLDELQSNLETIGANRTIIKNQLAKTIDKEQFEPTSVELYEMHKNALKEKFESHLDKFNFYAFTKQVEGLEISVIDENAKLLLKVSTSNVAKELPELDKFVTISNQLDNLLVEKTIEVEPSVEFAIGKGFTAKQLQSINEANALILSLREQHSDNEEFNKLVEQHKANIVDKKSFNAQVLTLTINALKTM